MYILDGHTPVKTEDMSAWSDWCFGPDNIDRRRVAWDEVGDVRISTVFMGINTGIDHPEFFETMILGGDHTGAQWRYETWDEAVDGHALAVRLVWVSVAKQQGRNGQHGQEEQSAEEA